MVRNCEFFLEDFKTLLGCFSIEERVRRISQIKVTHKFVSVLLFFYWDIDSTISWHSERGRISKTSHYILKLQSAKKVRAFSCEIYYLIFVSLFSELKCDSILSVIFLEEMLIKNCLLLCPSPLLCYFIVGKFRHLPVVENGEVIALLDITKCLYDAISRLEKAAEQGSAIAAAVEGVERQWGSNFSGQYLSSYGILRLYLFLIEFLHFLLYL